MTVEHSGNTHAELRGGRFYDQWVMKYFELGSVDMVVRQHPLEGVSTSELHRQLNERGVVKLRGPNTGMKNAFLLLWEILNERLSIESVYKSMPASIQEGMSIETLHRIWQNLAFADTQENKVRRFGTMLLIHPESKDNLLLVGRDVSPPSDRYGKRFGAWTFPMGFRPKGNTRLGALRILQQEVATPLAVRGMLSPDSDMARQVVPEGIRPLMKLNIADVRVDVVSLSAPERVMSFDGFGSSCKLTDFQWVPVSTLARELPDDPFYRSGVIDAARGYLGILHEEEKPFINMDSTLNYRLQQAFAL